MEVGYNLPTITSVKDGVTTTTPKPIDQWTQDEINLSNWNNLALYTIQEFVDQDEFKLIQICESAKEAWTILENRFEGNTSVKNSKIQRLTTEFELIRMSETEAFDQFHKRLRHIVNTLDNLGEKIQENRVVKKILRSLPNQFVPKITAIEESKDLNKLSKVDLV
ncbi:hypothetical protein [Bartonella sp. AP28SXKL]|uniref:hypothetical protein n=1 Tax=Bartonella sp. AP28SXKL TaxID=3243484 RepID=UPI0035D0AEC8